MMHRATVDQTTAPEFSREQQRDKAAKLLREARDVPPGLVLWSEELERRKTAVERWRGTSGSCAVDRAERLS